MNVRFGSAVLAVVVALAVAGCSSGPSAAVRNKRVCAAYETFWDTSYAGGKPSTTMLAREQTLLDAIAHARDKKLGAAAKAVVDGELSTPALRPGESGAQYSKDLASVSGDAKRKLDAIEPNDKFVESRCDQLGRHING